MLLKAQDYSFGPCWPLLTVILAADGQTARLLLGTSTATAKRAGSTWVCSDGPILSNYLTAVEAAYGVCSGRGAARHEFQLVEGTVRVVRPLYALESAGEITGVVGTTELMISNDEDEHGPPELEGVALHDLKVGETANLGGGAAGITTLRRVQ